MFFDHPRPPDKVASGFDVTVYFFDIYNQSLTFKDQPLPADASPIAASPDYVADSDPEEDLEDDQADYPTDRGDGDDEHNHCFQKFESKRR
nr:hypothetical protein [Tanacetum cinerariifolium]